ncbi:serine protease [Dysgonomonas sp. 25]|uniref:trypsin-like serine peptidase n=1 Tax=Dysgonomonas sp. 25 TaxID=2302933 RepID=UPI0013D5BD09|nr:S1 family peptidase [Dysgonomonas sp. 25]NDV67610.1 hypothetical protein [Dysgonomonas sp. 25]
MKKPIVLLLIISLSTLLSAQVSEGGIPPSFDAVEAKIQRSERIYDIRLTADINKLKQEDALVTDKNIPSRVAVIVPVNKDLARDGEWQTLESGETICRLTLKSEGAKGIVLYYSKFRIPYGGKLFIYDKDQIQLLGAYTHRTNPRGAEFVTEMVYGDELVLEYVAPSTDKPEKPQIVVSDLAHAYNHIEDNIYAKALPDSTGFRASGSCQVNINCPEGNSWQVQKKGVARTYTKIGTFMYRCSGTLINNTNNDKRAFFLSAYHCFYQGRYTADFNTILFYFNYEFPGCTNGVYTPTETKTLVGAQLRVASPIDGGSDGALLELLNPIPDDYDVYFNGWDITNTPSPNGVCIHHPQGDVKKVSTYTTATTTGTYSDTDDTSIANAHWVITFSQTTNGHGTTEGGSSGSPLFNKNGLLIGSLTGGSSGCTNRAGEDYFGKIFYHYDQHPNTTYHMKPYLNPSGETVTTLPGRHNYDIPPVVGEDLKPVFAYWDPLEGYHLTLRVRVRDAENEISRIRIVNFRGYTILDKNGKFDLDLEGIIKIDTTGWPRGLYILIADTKDGRFSFKLIK